MTARLQVPRARVPVNDGLRHSHRSRRKAPTSDHRAFRKAGDTRERPHHCGHTAAARRDHSARRPAQHLDRRKLYSRYDRYAVRQSVHFEFQPPLYFVLLTIWRKVCETAFFSRLFSVFLISSFLIVISNISRRLIPDISPAFTTLIFALNPFVIWAAVEARVYALALLLSSLLVLFFVDGFLVGKPKKLLQFSPHELG